MIISQNDWKIVDGDIKHQLKLRKNLLEDSILDIWHLKS